METTDRTKNHRAVTRHVLSLRHALKNAPAPLFKFRVGSLAVDVLQLDIGIYALLRRPGRGGLAVRLAAPAGNPKCRILDREPGERLRLSVEGADGEHLIVLRCPADGAERLRATVQFTPFYRMWLSSEPRDLTPLGSGNDPLAASGAVEAAQRGLNAGLVYFRLEEPAFGNVLYFQNLTALNEYFLATGTKPDGVVGGEWPDLGYLMPVRDAHASDAEGWLEAGQRVTMSDAILVFRENAPPDERSSALQFVQMLGDAYAMLELPQTHYRDWMERSDRAARDLEKAPEATIRHYGRLYVHPYTAAEYPDCMVQMSVIAALHDWGKWRGEPHPLEHELKAGLRKFYDAKLRTLRRYLPNVGNDKDADAVDSWYLYHPLLNLAALALDGDGQARKLFLDSIDYGVRAARHFKYRWPIQYKITDFSVIEAVAPADGRGQTDVGGLYAWVMLQAFALTDDKRFLDEARAALDAASGLRFNLNYQANLTAWGAAACLRMWRLTDDRGYLDQSYVYVASLLHNCVLWDSQLGHARHYENFLGVTCLQDAPYMAMYECFETFAAFEQYLAYGGADLDPAARMLVSEYCKYALSRAWFYYPDALPEDAISAKQREGNGHIDRALSFPLEDLYPDGQQAGQVGQEVYGAGAAFIFASRAFHRMDGVPFIVHCDHFLHAMERIGERTLRLHIDGGETCVASLRLIGSAGSELPRTTLTTAGGDVARPQPECAARIHYRVPASGELILTWA